MDATYQDKMK